jgi:hypothetical protein
MKQKESWSIKDKFIVRWIIICFISTLIISVVIALLIITCIVNSKYPQFTSECKSLNNKFNRRLKESLLNTSLIRIISVDNSSLIFKSDCNTNFYDELNNTYQITGSFQLICGEEREFNYTDSVEVWHTGKCCYKASIPDEWLISDSEEIIIKGKDFTEKDKCAFCRNFCNNRYKILQHKEKLQLCHWEEIPLIVNVNGEVLSISETTAISNPILQTPFGIWKNSSFSLFEYR